MKQDDSNKKEYLIKKAVRQRNWWLIGTIVLYLLGVLLTMAIIVALENRK